MLKKKKKESKTIVASIEIIVLEYVMEIPRGGGGTWVIFWWVCEACVVANYRPHLCPFSGKIGMEWEPFIKY